MEKKAKTCISFSRSVFNLKIGSEKIKRKKSGFWLPVSLLIILYIEVGRKTHYFYHTLATSFRWDASTFPMY